VVCGKTRAQLNTLSLLMDPVSKTCPLECTYVTWVCHTSQKTIPRSGKSINFIREIYADYTDYACKMGSMSLAVENIFRILTADKKTLCESQIKLVGGFCGEKRTRPWHVSLNKFIVST
jgi:hypothetical protein